MARPGPVVQGSPESAQKLDSRSESQTERQSQLVRTGWRGHRGGRAGFPGAYLGSMVGPMSWEMDGQAVMTVK